MVIKLHLDGCCLTTGIGTVMNQSKVKINEKVLIVGAGSKAFYFSWFENY